MLDVFIQLYGNVVVPSEGAAESQDNSQWQSINTWHTLNQVLQLLTVAHHIVIKTIDIYCFNDS